MSHTDIELKLQAARNTDVSNLFRTQDELLVTCSLQLQSCRSKPASLRRFMLYEARFTRNDI